MAATGRTRSTTRSPASSPTFRLISRRLAEGRRAEADIKKLQEQLGVMGREVERATNIVLNLLDFTAPQGAAKNSIELNALVEESFAGAHGRADAPQRPDHEDVRRPPGVTADPAQIKQVFLNILTNACEAMLQGGSCASSRAGVRHRAPWPSRSRTRAPASRRRPAEDLRPVRDDQGQGDGPGAGRGLRAGGEARRQARVREHAREGTCMTVVLPSGWRRPWGTWR